MGLASSLVLCLATCCLVGQEPGQERSRQHCLWSFGQQGPES